MKKQLILFCAVLSFIFEASSQSFTDSSSELSEAFNSGGCVAVTDMNGDGYDDILTLNLSNEIKIFYQNLEGVPGYTLKSFGSISGDSQWGMAVADINNDGHKDVFAGGSYDGVHYCQIINPDTHNLIELPEGMFMQGANLADINNDGWLDAFGCHDDAESNIWGNDGAGNLTNQGAWIDMATTPESDNSGNYGSVWCDIDNDNDLDLVIAKCRQFVNDPQDPRRINAAFINDGDNNYSDEAYQRGLVLYEQSWTVDFADFDNDGDFDCFFTNHSTTLKLMENDGCGNFTDITVGTGLDIEGFFLQAKMADFDNDGWVDVLYSGGLHAYHKNNGDGTFSEVSNLFPNDDTMHSFGVGDLNNDGWLDVYASYGDTYVSPDLQHDDMLWLNDGGSNNWIGFDLEGTDSNRDAVGAKIQIYGDFGTQIREIRSGESYGITNSNLVHFGIGENETVDYVSIKWPSGNVTVLESVEGGSYYQVTEESCGATEEVVTVMEEVICEGFTTTASVDTEGIVLWSNGAVGASVEVAGGNHSAVVYVDGCASLTNSVCVVEELEIDPTITALGNVDICEGSSVTLEAPEATAYNWSNDEESQSIEVSVSGDYSVIMDGLCSEELTSNVITVTVLDGPDSVPTSEDVSGGVGAVEVSATGTNLVWFSDAEGTDIIGEGSPINVDVTENTTVYVANQEVYGTIVTANGGKEENTEPGQYHDNSANGLVFSLDSDMVIKDVTVFANGEDERTIAVYDSSNNMIVSETFLIPDGESVVELNFTIPAGDDYVINTTDDNPQLWRDAANSGVSFPYELGDFGAITGTTINGANEFNYYYFFYDWNVETPSIVCYSDLVPVVITVTGIEEFESINEFNLYPNPASTEIRYEYNSTQAGKIVITLSDNQGREVYSNQLRSQVGTHQGVIDLSDFAPGVYTFGVIENGKVATEKIIIE